MRCVFGMLWVFGLSCLASCGSSGSDARAPGASTGGTSSAGGATTMNGSGGSPAATGGSASAAGGASVDDGGVVTGSGGGSASGGGGTSSSAEDGGALDGGPPPYADVKAKIDAYKAAHPGKGGKDWDINAKTPAEIAADPAAAELLGLCGKDQRPVIPALAWEYGGADHQWINPDSSALVYCVYVPATPNSDHWSYDAAADHVTADVYVLYPAQNPCKDKTGADQVLACLGDPTNSEILVDTASLNDGAAAGLSLANSSTELRLIQSDGTTIHLLDG